MPDQRPLVLRGAQVFVDGGLVDDVEVVIANGVVTAVGTGVAPADAEVITGAVVSPGLVDLHVHAVDGAGVVRRDALDPGGLAAALATHGVTSFLATTIAADAEELVAAVAAVAAMPANAGARCLGVHLEGPWLSPDRPGAQPVAAFAAPDTAVLERLVATGPVAMVTLAPELPGATDLVAAAVRAGVVVALGHSSASYDQTVEAVEAGARHVTHAFNATAGLHHREPGLIGAALDLAEVTVEAIADGVHLHPATVRLLWRVCGADRLCLVSDAAQVAGLVSTDAVRRPDGVLAGSAIGLDTAVRNTVSWGVPLVDALTMASTTPARVVGRDDLGAIRVGGAADLVVLDEQLAVVATVVDGRVVHRVTS